MNDVIIAVVVLIVVCMLAMLALAIGTHATLARRNRVVSDVPSPAPIGWLASSRREAVLHRRLRASGRRLELVASTEGLADLITRLQVELVDLDTHLVTVARRPTASRRLDRAEIAEQVTAVEDLVRRVEERSRNRTVSLDELSERLDLLEAADEEIRGLDPG